MNILGLPQEIRAIGTEQLKPMGCALHAKSCDVSLRLLK